MKLTWQLLLGAVAPAGSVQLPELPNAPVVGPEVNATCPVGATAGLAAVSVTVIVHVACVPVVKGEGMHASIDEVGSAARAAPGATSAVTAASASRGGSSRRTVG